MIGDFDGLVKQKQELKSWWSLKTTLAKYDNTDHSLRVDVGNPTMVAFCGQQYAGAQNYHDAPKFFTEAIQKEIQSRISGITEVAYEKEIARIDSLISQYREEIIAHLESIKSED